MHWEALVAFMSICIHKDTRALSLWWYRISIKPHSSNKFCYMATDRYLSIKMCHLEHQLEPYSHVVIIYNLDEMKWNGILNENRWWAFYQHVNQGNTDQWKDTVCISYAIKLATWFRVTSKPLVIKYRNSWCKIVWVLVQCWMLSALPTGECVITFSHPCHGWRVSNTMQQSQQNHQLLKNN